jgi:uncharacterized membrane protein
MHYVYAYLVTVVVFVGVDLLWLGGVAKSTYENQLQSLMKSKPDLPAAIVFYLLYAMGLMVFVIHPAMVAHSGVTDWWKGGLFGLFAYGTYDLTNLATLKNWPLKITVIDLIWGSFLTTMTTLVVLAIFAH